jgi:hypothetical protein
MIDVPITDAGRQLLEVMIGATGLAFILLLAGSWLGNLIRVDSWGW